jgi:hypothetical protein
MPIRIDDRDSTGLRNAAREPTRSIGALFVSLRARASSPPHPHPASALPIAGIRANHPIDLPRAVADPSYPLPRRLESIPPPPAPPSRLVLAIARRLAIDSPRLDAPFPFAFSVLLMLAVVARRRAVAAVHRVPHRIARRVVVVAHPYDVLAPSVAVVVAIVVVVVVVVVVVPRARRRRGVSPSRVGEAPSRAGFVSRARASRITRASSPCSARASHRVNDHPKATHRADK